ncbi:MAG TPA: hypothetical protein DEB30_01890 [Candidatus Peribacter riflensis]|uniref:Uncharacterized protein n=1 Tax=Candidatus Peribacter riflensis TaxID=1735162 RepID=A0A0S1SJC7_9BACT|nr:MAG: hypothetical protein PeribacterA2_0324 [Candidatus Peribacter riflensis]OGJ78289.1 MAG: hypothetical protein A2398_05380 [Candidatus Peribacteria bacterium RIFOXYB1_FULL_57_12]OGJ81946.1 MAG: hypothetical protein A2412_00400 [Candidatus Peribacteria bacterium RIFOXYC1_FULL_58_8]ALM10817.1 MAG: hypothetical protein PeribacterB2_0324 [Candidatus Peribacter riflensis]ALM11919.1 MAG: hypothetical protein PeribacterC2_0323 [Candidatus Peribacter riflensis]
MAGVIDAAEKAADVETTIRRVISTATRDQPLFEQQYKLSELLDRVERRLIELRERLLSVASASADDDVQHLIALMRKDERYIMDYCIHRCDHEEPMMSVEHDLTNNDYSLTLQHRLAAARHFGIAPRRVLFLHHLQREICAELKKRGIDTSQN